MQKYHGALIDDQGYTVFEFTTRFCHGRTEAYQQAGHILDAWKATHQDQKFYITLEGE